MIRAKSISAIGSVTAALALGLGLVAGLNPARGYAVCGEVCITDLRTDGSNVHVAWTGNPRFVSYQVSWEVGNYLEIKSQSVGGDQFAFDIPDAKPGEIYEVTVAGCTPYIPLFATSRCGPTDQRTVTA